MQNTSNFMKIPVIHREISFSNFCIEIQSNVLPLKKHCNIHGFQIKYQVQGMFDRQTGLRTCSSIDNVFEIQEYSPLNVTCFCCYQVLVITTNHNTVNG